MAFPVTKVLIGVGTAGVLGGSSYGIYSLTKDNDSVENYLKKQSLTVVSYGANEKWEKAFKTYSLEKAEKGSEILDRAITKGNDIRDWCKDKLKEVINSTSSPIYQLASQWCVEYTTIKEQINSSKQLESNLATLNSKHSQLPKAIQNELKKITDTDSANPNGAKIKKWCENNLSRRYSDAQEIHYTNVKQHCFTA
ncbi:hypothetical protein A6V39_03905 [Candidatus Mycoplasma haematobovis]|uniref:Uncharacterized protein n=1 Tax=Candidatus Mycoplasma haematobovis TaxID=432608 RepID=A0A1A9QBS6_9MOLU|nr:hypothetical protein [Candidatus Mycoplasma haematobovis]OAL10032.1 hypothetical protein A6V39_03905 [Candidatus Mycoplasma haematobovis]